TFKAEAKGIYEIIVDAETIYVTAEHPFYVTGKGWIESKDLQAGYSLKSPENNTVMKISRVKSLSKTVAVYNIEVNGNHNYFVTGSTILVHNKNIRGLSEQEISEPQKEMQDE